MTTVAMLSCACSQCQCKIAEKNAVTKDGKFYCSEECANQHPNQKGCGKPGCHCGQLVGY